MYLPSRSGLLYWRFFYFCWWFWELWSLFLLFWSRGRTPALGSVTGRSRMTALSLSPDRGRSSSRGRRSGFASRMKAIFFKFLNNVNWGRGVKAEVRINLFNSIIAVYIWEVPNGNKILSHLLNERKGQENTRKASKWITTGSSIPALKEKSIDLGPWI